MAVVNALDAVNTRLALGNWLAERIPQASQLKVGDVSVPQASGLSMTTVLFDAEYSERGQTQHLDLVARVAPVGTGLTKTPDLGKEFRILTALAECSAVPVPRMRWYEPNPTVLGAEFVVMDRADGMVPADDPPYTTGGWVLDLAIEERERLVRNGIQAMVALHQVDWRAAECALDADSRLWPVGIDELLGWLTEYYTWAVGDRRSPTIEAALAWAQDHKPRGEDLVISWGDARPGNIIYGPDQSVRAMLDWEFAALASPELDLGWWLFVQRHHTEGIGAPLPDGILDRAATIAYYEELSGRTTHHVDFYEAYAALSIAIMMIQVGKLMIDAGALPADHPMPFTNPASILLARMLDLPAPDGDASFLEGRTT